jgi:DASS family divalent anion:Na+ symporter
MSDPGGLNPTTRAAALAPLLKWGAVFGVLVLVLVAPRPDGVTQASWILFAIFAATIVGLIVRPIASGAVVLLGVVAVALTGVLPPAEALRGYADPIVWLVLCAFFMSRAVLKTGLGRRIAYLFIRALGRRSIGLAYALVCTDTLLASIVPSNAARAGGVIFPVARSLAEAYNSTPGPTAARLGSYLMVAVYQSDVVACSMWLTGQASNVLIARFALETSGVDVTYPMWILGAVVPGLLALLMVPLVIFRLYPPEVTHTPHATEIAHAELTAMGPMSRAERLTLLVFLLVAGMWITTALHHLNYAVVALVGFSALLLLGVLDWDDVLGERSAWDVFIWYGGLVRMAEALGETGITKAFAEATAGFTAGWAWPAALGALLLVYFYAHYGFASITAHATAMFVPFLVVIMNAGAPTVLAVLLLAYFSNLCAGLTHYGTTPAPIYFGARYNTQRAWWKLGFIATLVGMIIYSTIGVAWWKVLGWW